MKDWHALVLTVDDVLVVASIVTSATDAGMTLSDVEISRPNLESVFLAPHRQSAAGLIMRQLSYDYSVSDLRQREQYVRERSRQHGRLRIAGRAGRARPVPRRAMEAEVRALRAQISPHFVYNALTAIASFVRTDPERARELLLEFADFTRYSFRAHGEFTTLAEELRSIDRYLMLEQARFGDRLQVQLQIAPEVLPVAVPFLCLQPLVENAVRHGLSGKPGVGHGHRSRAEDAGARGLITVEDDGVGMDPSGCARVLAGEPDGDSVGLGNVDERLRSGLRRRVRAGGGDRARGGHEGDHAGAEVRPGRAG